LSTLRRYSADRTLEQIVAPPSEAFCGEAFERLCREALLEIYVKDGVRGPVQVGEYWDKSIQIDLVGLRDDGWVDVVECRWFARLKLSETSRDLLLPTAGYPSGQRTVRPPLFTRRKPSSTPRDIPVYDLASMYKS
jgi:hypothetical protein